MVAEIMPYFEVYCQEMLFGYLFVIINCEMNLFLKSTCKHDSL
jgi:hypothetical protein